MITNFRAQNQYQDFTFYLVTVTKDGDMFWKPASLLETNCRVDVTMYPYDFQTCAVKIGSWSYPNTAQKVRRVNGDNFSSTGKKSSLPAHTFQRYKCM